MKGNKVISVSKMSDYSKEDLKKHNIVEMKRLDIHKLLEQIHEDVLHKHGHCLVSNVVYDWLKERCIIKKDDKVDFVFKTNFDKFIAIYKSGKVHSSLAFGNKKFNPLVRLFLEGDVSEC